MHSTCYDLAIITLIVCRLIVVIIKYGSVQRTSIKSRFGSTVRSLRDNRGFSQEELAERAGLHRNYVGGVERGERNVAFENIVKFAKALSIPTRDLFTDFP